MDKLYMVLKAFIMKLNQFLCVDPWATLRVDK